MIGLSRVPAAPIPGPRVMPFVGPTGNLVRFLADPVGTLLALRRNHGEVAALADGCAGIVCVFGAEHTRQVLGDPRTYHNFSDFFFPVAPDSCLVRLNTALTSMNGETHKRQRRLMTPAFSKQRVESFRDVMVSYTERFLDSLPPGATIDVSAKMIELTCNIATRCLFGVDVTDGADHLGHLGMQLLEGFVSPSVMLFPYRVPGTPYDRLHRVGDRIEAELRGLIRERRERPDDRTDVLSLLIRAHDEDGTALTEDELVGQANVLFIAGHETMAHTLSWTLFLLARHPAVAGALREELAGGLGGSPPTVEQLARLPLLDAVVKESMRLLPATPFLFLRVAQADVQVGRYTLPRGAHLVPSPLVTHRDPAVFANPDRFQPGRWLDGLTPAPYQYLPFGAGPRMCIGAGFAAQALRVVLATLLLRVRFDLAPSAKVSRKVQGITMGPKYGLPMIVSRPNAPVPALGPLAGDIGELVAVA